MKDTREIKSINTRLRQLDKELEETKFLMVEYQRSYHAKQKEQRELNDKLKSMKNTLKITEHAMLRYFERVLGYDLERISLDILSKVSETQALLGDANYPCEMNGLTFHSVVKGNNIVTITKD